MNQTIPAECMKRTIAYIYLLSYCPLEQLNEFKRGTAALRKQLAAQAGLKEKAYFTRALPEACQCIVAFHQATREPDKEKVQVLVKAALTADKNPDTLAAFKAQMVLVADLPGRAKPENRLHRNKGCHNCTAACQHGFFTLVSDPQFDLLQKLFEEESKKTKSKQTPLLPAYTFAVEHLVRTSGAQVGFCEAGHAANLAYCLLMLSMAKSRMAVPEAQLQIFQQANQKFVRRLNA